MMMMTREEENWVWKIVMSSSSVVRGGAGSLAERQLKTVLL